MAETLAKQGITKETLEADQERFAERDHLEEMEKVRRTLEVYFGGEDLAKQAIKSARNILKRFGKPADFVFLEESGLGNDPELIKKLAEIGRIFEQGGKKKK